MDTSNPAGPPDHRFRLAGLSILLLACILEVATLYLLIAVETPVTPLVRHLMRNPFGLFTLVIGACGVVVAVMTTLLSVLERRAARRAKLSGAEGNGTAPGPTHSA